MRRHGGRSRLEAYAADPTERRYLNPVEYRNAFLINADRLGVYTKNGLQFENQSYVGIGPEVGRQYQFRYLPTNRDFIEVYDLRNEWVATCFASDSFTRDQARKLVLDRAETERHYNAIAKEARAYKQHIADAAWAHVGTDDVEDWTGARDRREILGHRNRSLVDDGSGALEPDTDETNSDSDPDASRRSPPTKRQKAPTVTRTTRPEAPRIPAKPVPKPPQTNPRLLDRWGMHSAHSEHDDNTE